MDTIDGVILIMFHWFTLVNMN